MIVMRALRICSLRREKHSKSISVFTLLCLTGGQGHPSQSPVCPAPSSTPQGHANLRSLYLWATRNSTSRQWSLKLLPLSVQSALRHGGSSPIMPSPHQGHQYGTSLEFCLDSRTNNVCGLLTRSHSVSSLCPWPPGRLRLPPMKPCVQPVLVCFEICRHIACGAASPVPSSCFLLFSLQAHCSTTLPTITILLTSPAIDITTPATSSSLFLVSSQNPFQHFSTSLNLTTFLNL